MKNIKQKSIIIITVILLIVQIICECNKITVFSQVIKPVLWLLFGVYLIIEINKTYFRFYDKNKHLQRMLIITLFYYVLYFYIGFIFGFVKSPYSHNIFKVLHNIFSSLMPIIGIELARSLVLNNNKEKNKVVIVIMTILLFLVEINYGYMLDNIFLGREERFTFIAQEIMPLLASSILYSYLTLKAGVQINLIYRIPDTILIYLLPIIPDMDWFLASCLGIIIPVVIYLLFQYVFPRKNKTVRTFRKKNKVLMVVALVFSILLASFMLGLFKFEPVAIVSNSMKPTYTRGDVVIYEKMSDNDLKKLSKDSILIYRIGGQLVAHRVVSVIEENGTIKYQTKGDYNNTSDNNLVSIDQILGVYRFHIKYIGYPSVWLNDFFNEEKSVVETK